MPAFHAFTLLRAQCLLHEPGSPEPCTPASGSLLCLCKVGIIRALHGVILKIKGSAMCIKPLIIILTTATTSIAALLQIAKHLLSPRPWVKCCTQVSHPAPENPGRCTCNCLPSTQVETEPQGGEATCPGSHSEKGQSWGSRPAL